MVDSDSEFDYILAPQVSDRTKDRRDREKEKERGRENKTREKERGRERDMKKKGSSSFVDSPPHRRDSTNTRPSPGPSSRRPIYNNAIDGTGTTKRGRSPALSASSDQLERLRKDNQYRTNASRRDSYLPSTSRHSRSRSRDRGGDRQRADLPSKLTPAGGRVPDIRNTNFSIAQHPSTSPPEPPKPPPMQPPPPPPKVPEVPKVPSFVSNQQTTSSAETAPRGFKENLSMDEQRSAWHERIEWVHIILLLVH